MDKERSSGSDAIFGDFLTHLISTEQSEKHDHDVHTSAMNSLKQDALIEHLSPGAHKLVDDFS